MSASPEHEDWFASLEQQQHAARFGMWIFLATEVLLFGGLFALFASYRVQFPGVFHEAIAHADKILGSVNTAVLLVSSTLVACSVHMLRAGRIAATKWLLAGTMVLGVTFLGIKAIEWTTHFHQGLRPGQGPFWSLYFGMTGLHALHVIIGLIVLGTMLGGLVRGTLTAENHHRLEIGAIYWHLVDLVWIFLWPLFYLA